MPTAWHNINSPGFSSSFSKKKEQNSKPAENVEIESVLQQPAAPKNEVEFIEAKIWEPGADGFEFNKNAVLTVKAKFLQETARRKITGSLFVVFNEVEEDLKKSLDAIIDDDATARFTIPLYYGDAYYNAGVDDPTAKCFYIVKNIRHSRGRNTINSERLEMPRSNDLEADFVEVPDILFNHDSAVPCLDENHWLLQAAVTALAFVQEHENKELVIFGHTDRSGDGEYNLNLSKLRSGAFKAILDGDATTWEEIRIGKSKVEDRQRILKTLSTKFGWTCDPGAVDDVDGQLTQSAVRAFHAEYNSRFSADLDPQGTFGKDTWEAVLRVYRHYIATALKAHSGIEELSTPVYGYNSTGIYPCGENLPKSPEYEYRSETDRRVELVFYDKGEIAGELQSPAAKREMDQDHCPITLKKWTKKIITPMEIDFSEKTKLKIRITGGDGDTLQKKEPYVLKGDGWEIEGMTTDEGFVETEIPKECTQITLCFGEEKDEEYHLRLGELRLLDTIEGVQARLNNLGYSCGKVDGVHGPKTKIALRMFQNEHGLAETGEIDDETKNKLLEKHGS